MILSVWLWVAAIAVGEDSKIAKVDFAAISERGRALYAYDQAAWHGTDAIFALKPDMKGLSHYLCSRTSAGWQVVFPRWNDAHDQLLVLFEATESNNSGVFTARKYGEPQRASSDLIAKERALELAIADFPKPDRPYNTAILPAPDGLLYVYIYPGQTKENVWPIGGDIRYTISTDGQRIVEKRTLHQTILDMEVRPTQAGGYHSHELSGAPEDTDVFYVLNRKPSMPEFISTSGRLFVIDKEGNIESGK
jgi:hypothetical protein